MKRMKECVGVWLPLSVPQPPIMVPGATCRVEANTARRVVASKGGELLVSLTLDGPMTLRIGAEKPR